MDNELDWIGRLDEDENNGAAERYAYFMRPEPFEDLGPIKIIKDPKLGKVKVRDMKIGMVRNAKSEDKKSVRVYLHPFPHIRIDKGKPLQGWYKAVHEPPNKRPRPCFTEAILTEPYGGYCLAGDTLVATTQGPVPIKDLQPYHVVYGEKDGQLIETEIKGWMVSGEKPIVNLHTSLGTVRSSADHPIYSEDRHDYVRTEALDVGEGVRCLEERYLSWLFDRSTNRPTRQSSKVVSGLSQYPSFTQKTTGKKAEGSLALSSLRSENQWIDQSMFRMSKGSSITEREESSWKDLDQRSSLESDQKENLYHFNWEETVRRTPNKNYSESKTNSQTPLSQSSGNRISISLGILGSGVSGLLRTNRHPTSQRGNLYTRLSIGRRIFHRSKGVHGQEVQVQNQKSQSVRLRDSSLESKQTKVPWYTGRVLSKKVGPIEKVYDIETVTGNFLIITDKGNGLLVHNCAVGCAFCYINSGVRGYRGTGLITVPENYGDQIRTQLASMNRSAAGYFSSFTDPFTPLEKYYHNTQEAAEAFVEEGLPIFFLSRLRYPDWAIDLLQQNKYSYAQKSINTPDPNDWRLLSPGAISLEEHLDEINKLHNAGIYVSIQCNPIVPGVTSNAQVVQLFKKLKKAGADHVIVKFVEAGYSWAPDMVARIKKRFGKERGEEFERLFCENMGGQRSIAEDYRLKAHKLFKRHATKIGLTYATCYEYKYERDEAGTILSKTGVSIGREMTTADQCHGHAVPMFVRDLTGRFKEVEECPPTGCMYCASENNGEARCGDVVFEEGKALRLVDLKIPFPKS